MFSCFHLKTVDIVNNILLSLMELVVLFIFGVGGACFPLLTVANLDWAGAFH